MAMTLVMTTSMTISALAVPNPTPEVGNPGDFTNNAATTTVNVLGMTDDEIKGNLSAKVPLQVKLAVMGDGAIRGPGNYTVENTSKNKSIRVSNVKGSATNNYVLGNPRPDDTRLNIGALTFTPNLGNTAGTAVELSTIRGTGHNTTTAEWTMDSSTTTGGNASVGITFAGSVDVTRLPAAATQVGGEAAFYLVFTIEETPATTP